MRKDPFVEYSEDDFYRRYRLTKNCARQFSTLISKDLHLETKRNYCLSPELQLLTAFRFYATGSYQIMTGDTVRLSQPSVSRIITRVSNAITSRANEFIHLPSEEELAKSKQEFMNIAGFPGVVMCIDGTHIRIEKPRLTSR